jgi:hypothetical protein
LLADQRGQDAVEYGGVLLVVALIVAAMAALWTSYGPTFAHDVECLVEKVLGQGCSAPPAYPVSASVKTVGYSGRVAIVDGGHGYTITLTKLSNGTSTITAVNTGSIGVSAQLGAGVELGPLGGADADATIGGGGYGDQSETWTFPSWSEGQKYFNQISQGNALGLSAHDLVSSTAGSLPIFGGDITSAFDSLTGASGAPSQGSLPHKYLSSTSAGGGLQGSSDARAGVNFGPLSTGVGASLDAQAGIERINYGSEKGDWQLTAGLDGSADAGLTDALFGQADGAGNVSGEVSVTFSPNGSPEKLEVSAYGDGVWGIGAPQNAKVDVPGSDSGSGSDGGSSDEGASSGENGSSGEGDASSEGDSGDEPLLSVESDGYGGSGVGSVFTGTLDLSSDPQAEQDVNSILSGNPAPIGNLVSQVNAHGTETLQNYQITRSTSNVGAKLSVGAGVGVGLNNGSSNATYNPPETRENGGRWHQESQ